MKKLILLLSSLFTITYAGPQKLAQQLLIRSCSTLQSQIKENAHFDFAAEMKRFVKTNKKSLKNEVAYINFLPSLMNRHILKLYKTAIKVSTEKDAPLYTYMQSLNPIIENDAASNVIRYLYLESQAIEIMNKNIKNNIDTYTITSEYDTQVKAAISKLSQKQCDLAYQACFANSIRKAFKFIADEIEKD